MTESARESTEQSAAQGLVWLKDRLVSWAWLLVLAAVLSLQVWFPAIDAGQVNDTYNVDIGGRNAFYQYVKGHIPDSRRNHESLPILLDHLYDATLCLLGPARYPSSREWSALGQWVQNGGKLLLAARWDDAELEIPFVQARVRSTKPKDLSPLEEIIKRSGKQAQTPEDAEGSGDSSGPVSNPSSAPAGSAPAHAPAGTKWTKLLSGTNFSWKSTGTIDAPGAEALVKVGESVQAARIAHGRGTIVLVASDQMFSNSALFERGTQNGLLAVRMLQAAGPVNEVVFDESLNQTGRPVVVGVLLDPILRATTVQIVVVLVIFLWRGNRRFGGTLPREAPARHDVADHTNSLGNLYYKAHHGMGVLREYLEQLRTDLRLRFSTGREERVLAPIAAKLGISVEEVQRQLAQADAAARKPRLTRREAAAQIRRLALLRQAARRG